MTRLYNGIVKENPVLVLLLGMCPVLAVTTTAVNGLGMGIAATIVLILSNLILSLLLDKIPEEARFPARVLTLAALVSLAELCVEACFTPLRDALGIYLPLLVLSGVMLGATETLDPVTSALDGVGKGLGFTLALTLMGALRELLGSGTLFGAQALPADMNPIGIFAQPPGALLMLALLIAILNAAEFGNGRLGWKFPSDNAEEKEAEKQ